MARRAGGRGHGIYLPQLAAGLRAESAHFDAISGARIHGVAAAVDADREVVLDAHTIWRCLHRVDVCGAGAFRRFIEDDSVLFRFNPATNSASPEEALDAQQ